MRAKLVVVLPIAVAIAAWETREVLHSWGARNAPVVEGDVIRREAFRRPGGIPAGQLTIRIAGTDTVVVAETNAEAMRELPRRVRFRYSGDPGLEVFVKGEEHPLGVVVFLWIVTAGIVALGIVPPLRRPEPAPGSPDSGIRYGEPEGDVPSEEAAPSAWKSEPG